MDEQAGTLELPTLGRPMCLGTLYDCRSHQVVSPGVPLWDTESISSQRKVREQEGAKRALILSDSFNDKSQALEIDDSLKASILAGSVDIKGSARYLVDHKPPESTCQSTLQVKITDTFEHLPLKQLDSCKVQCSEAFTQGKATHVVTGILYGSNAFFVFDTKCKEIEGKDSSKTLRYMVDKLASDRNDEEHAPDSLASEFSDVHCTVYSDLVLDSHPSDYEGAAKLLSRFPTMVRDYPVPVKVFLYPLHYIESRAARVCKVVSADLLSQVQYFLEGLQHCLTTSSEMAADPICTDFPQFTEKFSFFKRMLSEYQLGLQKALARVLPLIRGGSEGESVLKEMLQNAHSSPFNLAKLEVWLKSKRKELSAVKLYVRYLPDVEIVKSLETLEDILMDPGIDNVVCLTFRLVGHEEGFLTALSQYLATRKESSYSEYQWYDDMNVMKFMRGKAKLFAEFFQSNPQSRCTKFIVTGFHDSSSTRQEAKVGGTVLLYEQGVLTQEDFEPPSRPGKPHSSAIDHHEVELTWTAPEFGASAIQQYLIKFKRFRAQSQPEEVCGEVRTEKSDTSFKIESLEPNESLQFQVVAVCALGLSPVSEVSEMIRTLPASPPGKPLARPLSASSISLEWEEPAQLGKGGTIQSYVIRSAMVVNGALQNWQQELDTGSSETRCTVHQLKANATYTFQVFATYDSGVTSLSSARSDICTTFPVSQPGKPNVCNFTASSVTIRWKGPNVIGRDVKLREYFIEYDEDGQQKGTPEWKQVLTNSMDESCTVQGLSANTTYIIRVVLVCENDFMTPGEACAAFTTLPAGPPTGVTSQQISATDVTLTWTKPSVIGEQIAIQHYKIDWESGQGSDSNVMTKLTDGPCCSFTINEAPPETPLRIRVSAACGMDGVLGESSDVVEFVTRRPLKHDVKEKAECLQPGNWKKGKPRILKFPTDPVCCTPQSRSYSFGAPPTLAGEHKVIMVVGVTGSGKSTLINGMINHLMDVDRQDDFRFKIVDVNESKGASQAHSQTQIITSYTIHRNQFLYLPYTLTVIDTPGFGDTRGIERDKAIIDQIHEFFKDSASHGIDHIDAIGFVVQASQSRLTQTQKYVFDSILSVFGKDISENILLLVTFADSNPPPVLDAVEAAGIPYTGSMFKFNNSALFAEVGKIPKGGNSKHAKAGNKSFDDMFWQMGRQSLANFFQNIQTLEARSLVLTKEVLEERKRLEVAVQGLQPQIQMGICKLEELRKEHQILQQHEAEIEANKDFKFEVEIPKCKKIDISGNFITNCSKCHFTCHYPCYIADDAKKADCASMKDGVCTVCPGKCAWDVHFNQQYKFEYYSEKEEKTYEEIEERYRDATGKKMTVVQVIEKQMEEFKEVRRSVFALIASSHKSVMRLEEIALKPNPLSAVEYVDILIESEKRSGKPGWQSRMSALQDIRKEADIMGKLKQANYDPFENYKKELTSTKKTKIINWLKFW